ncbi:MAG TPA: YebC/PmpR family DNA-binding transcriptional regulator [Chloroflexota bacterium]|jgi:YebC/PmpR family DNA-binding regulatory protein|nr:YebC/PmpR family DNA-binding transcriptional regulator [Chloroflexota bacterium]
MSGHSKWAQIKRQKGANDAKRGQVFTRLGREIVVAAREGGGDPIANFRLRLAVQRAREHNMPADNIERAIKRGTGGGESGDLDEITYEGYGPGGGAVIVQVMTDNRNRAAGEVRNVFTKHGGSLGESGSVAWQFDDRGVITLALNGHDAEEVELLAIDAGAVEVQADGDQIEIQTEPTDLEHVRQSLESQKLEIINAERSLVPRTTVALDSHQAAQLLRLVDRLEELDDVQKVYSNVDIADEDVAAYAG